MADLIPMLAAVAGQAGEEADEDFNQTVLLLHGDGTNGAQNNTFLDSSTNNFTITRNGNTTQGTFSPFSVGAGEWSNYFDGTGDYLSISDSTAFNMGSGNFTCECWIYTTNASATATFLSTAETTDFQGFFLGMTGGSFVFLADGNGSTPWDVSITAGTVVANTWTHVAGVRNGNVFTLYINGSSVGTTTQSITLTNSNNRIVVGGRTASSGQYLTGYLSNARVVKGTAVYTSNFTPSTTPLTAITNTSLLTCQSNRFVDNSTNAFAITRNGDVRVTPFSPFAPSAAYSASTNGGSGYFDGTGDYLSIADAAGLRFGTGNFTIQAWIYRSAAGAVHSIAAKGGASTGWVFQVHSDNKLRFTQTTTNIDSTGTIPAGAWTHVAVVREGTGTNQTKLYINGVNDGQATVTTDFNQTEQLNIGADRGNANPMNGYIAGFKYVVGTAETITVPTAPPTGGTALLNFTNAGIFDNTGKNNLETVGNAQIDTGTKKFGTGSMEFDGTGDYLKLPSSVDLAMGTGDWTVEFWLYLNSTTTQIIFDNRVDAFSANKIYIAYVSNSLNYYTANANPAITGGSLATSTWHHVAISRQGSSTKLFINGTQAGSTYSDSQNYSASLLAVGAAATDGTFGTNGFIDDLRITKGVARYTANFTAPTKEFPDQ